MRLNNHFDYQGAGYSTTQLSTDLPRHRWYLIKEGFSPKLVGAALDSVDLHENDFVLDPFAGCGTVPLTAAQRGIASIGIEVNPFLSFVSKTKVQNCDAQQLRTEAHRAIKAAKTDKKARSALEGYSTFSPKPEADKWLFNREILRTFAAATAAVEEGNPRVRRFVRLALIKAAMDNCNARADGKCLRYRKDWKESRYGTNDFIKAFELHLETIAHDLTKEPLAAKVQIFNKDARKVLGALPHKFRLCVTSPPYLNSFDYSDVYRPEMFLTGMVSNTKQLKRIRLKTVRSHVQARWEPPTDSDFGDLYNDTMSSLRSVEDKLWDVRIPSMVQAYFEDMKRILRQMYQRADTNAQVWLVVSTSAYGGVEIPVDLILANIGTQIGWFLREVGVIRQIRHAGHHWSRLPKEQRPNAKLRESVVVLERPKTAK